MFLLYVTLFINHITCLPRGGNPPLQNGLLWSESLHRPHIFLEIHAQLLRFRNESHVARCKNNSGEMWHMYGKIVQAILYKNKGYYEIACDI